MVTTGLSKPYVAKYAHNAGTVTYSGGMKLGRGVSVEIEIDAADDNNFYADNVIAETESTQFTSGAATVTVDGLENEAAVLILGLPTSEPFEVGESKSVNLQKYGKNAECTLRSVCVYPQDTDGRSCEILSGHSSEK